jgi:DNA-binding response OmpR family regulator
VPTLLIIDDNDLLTDLWRIAFTRAGFTVQIARNAHDGLALARLDPPDLILLDERLPDIRGNDVLKALKHDPRTEAIPVVCMTHYDSQEVMDEAMKEGAVDYLFKDRLELPEIVTKIQDILKSPHPDKPPE